MPRRLAGRGVLLRETAAAIAHLEVTVDSAQGQRQGVQRSVRTRAIKHGVPWRSFIKLGAGRVALLAQPRDKDLLEHNPFAGRHHFRPSPDVGKHVADRVHLRDRVVELCNACRRGVRVGIDQPRNDHLPLEIDQLRAGSTQREEFLAAAQREHLAIVHRHRFVNGECLVHRHHFPPVENEIGLHRTGDGDPRDHDPDEQATHPRFHTKTVPATQSGSEDAAMGYFEEGRRWLRQSLAPLQKPT